MSGSESPSNCQTRPFSVMVGVAGGPGEGRKKAVKSGGGSGSKKLAKVSSTSWAIDNLRLRLSNKIEEGALREMLVGAASSTTPSGDSLVTPDEAIACFEAFLTEFFQVFSLLFCLLFSVLFLLSSSHLLSARSTS